MFTVKVGPFNVADVSSQGLTEILAETAIEATASSRPTVAFALHVGGLNYASSDARFVSAMNSADVLYADGASIVLIGRAAGARSIERGPTTDIGPALITKMADKLLRPPRIALVGGPPGLAQAAGEKLSQQHGCEIVFATDGFSGPLRSHADELRSTKPDLVFVGLGMPTEAIAVSEDLEVLPPALIMTCGGWFGFLAGHERRAPLILQKLGLEWTWRLYQAPTRLAPRYAKGLLNTLRHARTAVFLRWRQ